VASALYRLIHLMQTTETHKLIDLPKLPTSVYPEIETLQTALQHLLKRIRTNMDAQKRFTAHAAHELKTPLAQAVSELEVALPLTKSVALKTHIQTVKQDLLHINRKLESLLLLTRINDAGGIKPKKVRLKQVVQEVLESFRPQLKKLKLTTKVELAEDDYWWIVPDHLELLLINLIGNAIKYNKRQGIISISSFRNRRKQWLIIADTGVGIAKKEQSHLFKRFFRSEVTAQTIPGYGIGLTVVYSIAQRANLSIVVESTPGKGTSIRLGQRMTPIAELAT
jgi:two-component system, OmpR family, phosphate regulon sensor histidine kinase PhoR